MTDSDLRITGNHHLAFVVEDDISKTHRFWTETMGLRFSWAITNTHIPSTGEYSPHMHTFYELSKQGNVAYFAIQPDTMNAGPNWKDHAARFIALQAGAEDQLPRWRARLENAGIAVAEDVDEDGRPALAFRDPAGHLFKITPPARTYTPTEAARATDLVNTWIARKRSVA
jgi:glyoxylase I family protein